MMELLTTTSINITFYGMRQHNFQMITYVNDQIWATVCQLLL